MIIVCKNCRTSYLVATTVFTAGPRKVRCARCLHVWLEDPSKPKAPPPQRPDPQPVAAPPAQGKSAFALPPSFNAAFAFEEPPAAHKEPAAGENPPTVETQKAARTWRRPRLRLPSVRLPKFPSPRLRLPRPSFGFLSALPWRRIAWLSGGISALVIAATAGVFLVSHGLIIGKWPDIQRHYIMLGLAKAPLADHLTLTDIHSERRYMDGAMHLVVQGKIQSNAQKTHVIPALNVEALGPDERVIQSWRIEAPQATVKPGESVPFSSAVISQEGTVVEVNLSFVEPPHDER